MMLSGGRFVLVILLASRLSLADFGRFTFTQWLVDITFVSLSFGMNTSGNRYFAEYLPRAAQLRAFQRLFARWAVPVVILTATLSPLAALGFGQGLSTRQMLLQATWSCASTAWALLVARAQGLKQFRRVAFAHAGYVIVAIGGVLLLPRGGAASLDAAMSVVVLATAVAAALLWIPLPGAEAGAELGEAALDYRKLRQFALNIWIAETVAAVVWSRGELSVVRTMSSATEVAHYAVALQLASIAIIGTMLLTGALFPHLTTLFGNGEHVEMARVSRRATDWLLLVSSVLGIALMAFGPELLRVVFGHGFSDVRTSLAVLGLGSIGLASLSSSQVAQLISNARFSRDVNTLGAVLLLGLALAMVQLLGTTGAAVARSIVWGMVGLAFTTYAYVRTDGMAVSWRNLVFTVAVTSCCFAAAVSLDLSLWVRGAGWCVASLGLVLGIRDRDDGRSLLSQICLRLRVPRRP